MSTLSAIRVGLIGDRNLSVTAHRAIEKALPITAAAMGLNVEYEWLADQRFLACLQHRQVRSTCKGDVMVTGGLWAGSAYHGYKAC